MTTSRLPPNLAKARSIACACGMAIAHRDLNIAVACDASKREGSATGLCEIRQRGMPKAIRLEAFDQGNSGDPATKICGSGQFADVPDLLLELRRTDKRTQKGVLSVSKFRHGSKQEDLAIWFDAEAFRLISIPPVIYLLESGPRSRAELLDEMAKTVQCGAEQGRRDDRRTTALLGSRHGRTPTGFHHRPEAATTFEWFSRLESLRGKEGISQSCETPTVTLCEVA